MADRLSHCLRQVPAERREQALVMFSAHSIPLAMAENCQYELQLTESCRLVAEAVGHGRWELVYQSRSGPPQQPWLEPDICDRIEELHAQGDLADLVVVPIGFVSDHIEVLYDLDTEAAQLCDKLGIAMQRAATPGTHPRFVTMIRELIQERMRRLTGASHAGHDGPQPRCLP